MKSCFEKELHHAIQNNGLFQTLENLILDSRLPGRDKAYYTKVNKLIDKINGDGSWQNMMNNILWKYW